jgi:hypothetical protein
MPDDVDDSPKGGKCLGKKPARSDPRLLAFARFVQLDRVPATYNPWKKRAAFPARTYGNRDYGCCTRASQANHMTRLERIETKRTPRGSAARASPPSGVSPAAWAT